MLSRIRFVGSVGRILSRQRFATAAVAEEQPKAPPSSSELRLTFSSPLKAIYANATVKQVDAPGMASAVGILPIHVPTISVLKPGVVKVYEQDGTVAKYFVSSGSLTMNIDGTCQVLAEEICAIEELDEQAAKQLNEESQKKFGDSGSSDVERAEAGICLEVAEAVLKALSEK